MNLISVLSHSFKCQTCLLQRDFHWIVTWKKKLSPILFDLYQKNTDLEVEDRRLTQLGLLKSMSSSIKKTYF